MMKDGKGGADGVTKKGINGSGNVLEAASNMSYGVGGKSVRSMVKMFGKTMPEKEKKSKTLTVQIKDKSVLETARQFNDREDSHVPKLPTEFRRVNSVNSSNSSNAENEGDEKTVTPPVSVISPIPQSPQGVSSFSIPQSPQSKQIPQSQQSPQSQQGQQGASSMPSSPNPSFAAAQTPASPTDASGQFASSAKDDNGLQPVNNFAQEYEKSKKEAIEEMEYVEMSGYAKGSAEYVSVSNLFKMKSAFNAVNQALLAHEIDEDNAKLASSMVKFCAEVDAQCQSLLKSADPRANDFSDSFNSLKVMLGVKDGDSMKGYPLALEELEKKMKECGVEKSKLQYKDKIQEMLNISGVIVSAISKAKNGSLSAFQNGLVQSNLSQLKSDVSGDEFEKACIDAAKIKINYTFDLDTYRNDEFIKSKKIKEALAIHKEQQELERSGEIHQSVEESIANLLQEPFPSAEKGAIAGVDGGEAVHFRTQTTDKLIEIKNRFYNVMLEGDSKMAEEVYKLMSAQRKYVKMGELRLGSSATREEVEIVERESSRLAKYIDETFDKCHNLKASYVAEMAKMRKDIETVNAEIEQKKAEIDGKKAGITVGSPANSQSVAEPMIEEVQPLPKVESVSVESSAVESVSVESGKGENDEIEQQRPATPQPATPQPARPETEQPATKKPETKEPATPQPAQPAAEVSEPLEVEQKPNQVFNGNNMGCSLLISQKDAKANPSANVEIQFIKDQLPMIAIGEECEYVLVKELSQNGTQCFIDVKNGAQNGAKIRKAIEDVVKNPSDESKVKDLGLLIFKTEKSLVVDAFKQSFNSTIDTLEGEYSKGSNSLKSNGVYEDLVNIVRDSVPLSKEIGGMTENILKKGSRVIEITSEPLINFIKDRITNTESKSYAQNLCNYFGQHEDIGVEKSKQIKLLSSVLVGVSGKFQKLCLESGVLPASVMEPQDTEATIALKKNRLTNGLRLSGLSFQECAKAASILKGDTEYVAEIENKNLPQQEALKQSNNAEGLNESPTISLSINDSVYVEKKPAEISASVSSEVKLSTAETVVEKPKSAADIVDEHRASGTKLNVKMMASTLESDLKEIDERKKSKSTEQVWAANTDGVSKPVVTQDEQKQAKEEVAQTEQNPQGQQSQQNPQSSQYSQSVNTQDATVIPQAPPPPPISALPAFVKLKPAKKWDKVEGEIPSERLAAGKAKELADKEEFFEPVKKELELAIKNLNSKTKTLRAVSGNISQKFGAGRPEGVDIAAAEEVKLSASLPASVNSVTASGVASQASNQGVTSQGAADNNSKELDAGVLPIEKSPALTEPSEPTTPEAPITPSVSQSLPVSPTPPKPPEPPKQNVGSYINDDGDQIYGDDDFDEEVSIASISDVEAPSQQDMQSDVGNMNDIKDDLAATHEEEPKPVSQRAGAWMKLFTPKPYGPTAAGAKQSGQSQSQTR